MSREVDGRRAHIVAVATGQDMRCAVMSHQFTTQVVVIFMFGGFED